MTDELPAAIALRHRLHADPRGSGDEADTAVAVADALGYGAGERVARVGRAIVCSADASPAASVALRAELDALPIVERTGVRWAAQSGLMHACGHDVHLAGLVAAARTIAAADAPVPVVALLQPREEASPSGAREIVQSGLLDTLGVRTVIAAHVQPRVPVGSVAVTPGLVNASVDEIEVSVIGRGGHVGYPHTVADPVLALGNVIVSLQQIASRRVDPTHGAVCILTEIRAGNTANVVPDRAFARGTLRLLDAGDRVRMVAEVREIVQHAAAAYGCAAEVTVIDGEPALVNDSALAIAAARHLAHAGQQVMTDFRSFGADDFAYYCERGPALMAFIGVGAPHGPGLHDATFLPPDETVETVAHVLIAGYLAAIEDR
ncbi:MAG TPA: amidohydrolase [Steroidobacteraceae bacterium]